MVAIENCIAARWQVPKGTHDFGRIPDNHTPRDHQMPKVQPLRPTYTPIAFALQFFAHPMLQSRSAPSATLMR